METEWLFGIFSSIGRFIDSSSFIFEETILLGASVLLVVTDISFAINVGSFLITDEDSTIDFSGTIAAESSCVAESVNLSNQVMF